jgi:hypothetical protein
MAERSVTVLRRVAAELRAEVVHIDRTVSETEALTKAAVSEKTETSEKVTLYATAALLDTFYTGVEKAFRRIALELGGVPEGSGWHRVLLDDMALEIPKVRPSVLRAETARSLSRFLAFRHRFRNLYLFDLEPAPVGALVAELPGTWAAVRTELGQFALVLERLADELD